jgi:hypothetical protein
MKTTAVVTLKLENSIELVFYFELMLCIIDKKFMLGVLRQISQANSSYRCKCLKNTCIADKEGVFQVTVFYITVERCLDAKNIVLI